MLKGDIMDLAVAIYNDNKNITSIETLDYVKKSGFKNVFIQWYDDNSLSISQQEQLEYAKKIGLNIIFLHLGYQNINDIWKQGDNGDKLVDRYIENIKVCKKNNINLVVMHLTNGYNPPKYNELGLNRIKKIVEYAEKNNIKIAFENLKVKGYLEYVLDNINSKNIGICYDAGHDHLFFKDTFNFSKFKDKVLAVHFHDNDGKTDKHMLPMDGRVDWAYVVNNLKKINYNSYITLEICYRQSYLLKEPLTFFKTGYKRALKIKNMFEK